MVGSIHIVGEEDLIRSILRRFLALFLNFDAFCNVQLDYLNSGVRFENS